MFTSCSQIARVCADVNFISHQSISQSIEKICIAPRTQSQNMLSSVNGTDVQFGVGWIWCWMLLIQQY